MNNKKQIAQEICSCIVDASNKLNDLQKNSTPFAIDIYLDGIPYNALVIVPDKNYYDLGSRTEDYVGDSEIEYQALTEDIVFPCKSFSISNGVATFECIDPLEAKIKYATIG